MLPLVLPLLLTAAAVATPAWQDKRAEFDALYTEAGNAHRDGRFDDAIAGYERCLELYPNAPVCAFNIACAHALQEREEEALEWLNSAVDRFWGKHVGEVELLLTDEDLTDVREMPQFVDVLDRAEQRWILDGASMVEAARRRIAAGRHDLAMDWLERAVEHGWGAGPRDLAALRGDDWSELRSNGDLASRFEDVRERTSGRQNTVLASGAVEPVAMEWERGHRDLLLAVDAHPRGGRHLTAGRDRTIRVWNSETLEEDVTLRGHLATVLAASFSPDGDHIVSASRDTTARIWDARSGVQELVISCGGIPQDARYSADGGRVVTAGIEDRTVKVWNASTGALIATLLGHERGVWTAVFDPAGERVLSGGQDGTIRVHDAASGELLDTWRVAGGTVRGVTFSPDGQLVLATSWDGTCKLLDPRSGEVRLVFESEGRRWLESCFDPAGEWIASTHAAGGVVVWNAADGRELHHLTGHVGHVMDVAIDADGATAISAGYDGSSRQWNLDTGEPLRDVAGGRYRLFSARFSPDGSQLVTLAEDEASVWDLTTGRSREQRVGAPTVELGTKGAQRLLWRSPDAHDWSAGEGAPIASLPVDPSLTLEVFTSPGRERLYSITSERQGQLWNGDGSFIAILEPHRIPDGLATWEDEFQLACFSPDGALLLTVMHADDRARLWNASDGTLVRELAGHVGPIQGGAFDGTSERVVTVGSDGAARVWSTADGSPLLRLPARGLGLTCAAFDPDGTRIATGSYEGTLQLWDSATGDPLGTFREHRRPVLDVTFSPDGTRLASTSNDETARLWDVDEQRPLGIFVLGERGEWLSFTPEHYYVGTPDLVGRTQLVLGGEPFPLSCFESILARPDAVESSLEGIRAAPANVPRPPSLTLLEPLKHVHVGRERVVRLRARASDALAGIDRLVVVQDGTPMSEEQVRGAIRGETSDQQAELELEVLIPAGPDRTRVVLRAVSRRGVTSPDRVIELRYEPPTEDLYLLAIGVSDYEQDELDLEAPVLDVEGIVEFFEAQEGTLFDSVEVHSLLDDDVSMAAVMRARERFLLQAQDDDTIVVFVAGHGVLSELDEYWFLTPTATPEEPYSGVPRANLEELVTWQRLHARRRVMFLDTCHAGGSVEGARGVGLGDFLDADRANDLASSFQGLYILSASSEREFAREQEGNGIFTRALLDGLAGAADQEADGAGNANGYVEIEELLPFVRDAVQARSGGKQSPEYSLVEGGGNFRLARIAD